MMTFAPLLLVFLPLVAAGVSFALPERLSAWRNAANLGVAWNTACAIAALSASRLAFSSAPASALTIMACRVRSAPVWVMPRNWLAVAPPAPARNAACAAEKLLPGVQIIWYLLHIETTPFTNTAKSPLFCS